MCQTRLSSQEFYLTSDDQLGGFWSLRSGILSYWLFLCNFYLIRKSSPVVWNALYSTNWLWKHERICSNPKAVLALNGLLFTTDSCAFFRYWCETATNLRLCDCVLLAVTNMPVNLLSPHNISNSSMLSNVQRVNLPAVVVTAGPQVALPVPAQRSTAPNGKTGTFFMLSALKLNALMLLSIATKRPHDL